MGFPVVQKHHCRTVRKPVSCGQIPVKSRHLLVGIYFQLLTVDIYLFKVYDGNAKTMCEVCSKLTIKSK